MQTNSFLEPPKKSFWFMVKTGQTYQKTFPRIKILSLMFKEYHVIKVTEFAIKFMPPIAVFSICWALMLNANLAIATTAATFALSMPIQGLYWLGKRASSPIPSHLKIWLIDLQQKLKNNGQSVVPLSDTPTYLDFITLLNIALKRFDEELLESL